MFTLIGSLQDFPDVTGYLAWDAGNLSGDSTFLYWAERAAERVRKDGFLIGGPTGPFFQLGDMEDAQAVFWFLSSYVFAPGFATTGEVPNLPDVPEGRVS